MPKYDTDDAPLSSENMQKDSEEVIELDAVEIPRPRPTIHDIEENQEEAYVRTDYFENRRYNRPQPTLIFKTSQNAGCNCCLLWIFVFILAIFALF